MEPLSAFAAQKAKQSEKLRPLPIEFIFEMSSLINRALRGSSNRLSLFKRLRSYAFSKRRGKLRLPTQISANLRALTSLSKAQVRDCLYWLRASTSTHCPLNKRQWDFVKQHSAVPIWNRSSQRDDHMANTVGLPRLGKRDAPRITRALWPSAPSFSEMIEMARRNVLNIKSGHKHGLRYTAKRCITKELLSNNIRLATKIVSNNIVGIRSSVEIPEDFLPWFRHRHGFSILSVRHRIPSGLVRFLLAQWTVSLNSLWLLEHCPLRMFLRRHTTDDFLVEDKEIIVVVADRKQSLLSTDSREATPPMSGPRPLPDEDLIAEFGEEFVRNLL